MEPKDVNAFFRRYLAVTGVAATDVQKALALVKECIDNDPLSRTKYEVSFKVSHRGIVPVARFLNMDANLYSCKGEDPFLWRLAFFKAMMQGRVAHPLMPRIFRALCEVTATPVDFYVGADISRGAYAFAFWLIFGGVKRDGKVSFWPYDCNGIIRRFLSETGMRMPVRLRKDILNFGLDISNKEVVYKVYYLIRSKYLAGYPFSSRMPEVNRHLRGFKYFYFFSSMYDRSGRLLKTKLFLEFLQDIFPGSPLYASAIENVCRAAGYRASCARIIEACRDTRARISLISIEPDGTLTVYLRPKE